MMMSVRWYDYDEDNDDDSDDGDSNGPYKQRVDSSSTHFSVQLSCNTDGASLHENVPWYNSPFNLKYP